MIRTYTYKNITWTDVQSPDRKEIEQLIETLDLDPRIPHEILTPSSETAVKQYGDSMFAVFHFPVRKQTHSDEEAYSQEIDFIVGKDYLVTVRYDTVDTLHRFTRKMEVNAITHKERDDTTSPIQLMYSMLTEFYHSTTEELFHIGDSIESINKHVFLGRDKDILFEIAHIGKALLDFRSTLSFHTSVYTEMTAIVQNIFGAKDVSSSLDVQATHQRTMRHIEHYRQVIAELRETNQALLTTHQNEIMKTLTIMAFITFPLTLFTSMFGMNTVTTPILGHPFDFWIIMGIMVVVSIGFFAFFKYKKWI